MNVGLLVFYLALAVGFGISLARHGQPKKGNECIWTTIVALMITLVLIWWALGWNFI